MRRLVTLSRLCRLSRRAPSLSGAHAIDRGAESTAKQEMSRMPSWPFSSKHITEFARNLANVLAKRYPPALDVSPEKKVSHARLTKVLEETLLQAVEFQREHKLGMFGKAKLGNEFKWQLRDLGYTEPFIDVATEGLMVYITRGATAVNSAPVEKS
jgi:hypothetical protein